MLLKVDCQGVVNGAWGSPEIRPGRKKYAPDQAHWAFADFAGVHARNLRTLREDWVYPLGGFVPSQLAYSPDGRYLSIGDSRGMMRVLDSITGAMKWESNTHCRFVNRAPFSPDGKKLVSVDIAGKLRCQDASTGNILWEKTFKQENLVDQHMDSGVTFTYDGQYIAVGGSEIAYVRDETGDRVVDQQGKPIPQMVRDHYMYLLDAQDGSEIWKHKTKGRNVSPPLVTYDDDHALVLFGSRDHSVRAVYVKSGEPAWSKPFVAEGEVVSSPAISPILRSGLLVAGDLKGKIYGISLFTGEKVWGPVDTGVPVKFSPAFTYSGRSVVFSGKNFVGTINAATGREYDFVDDRGEIFSQVPTLGPMKSSFAVSRLRFIAVSGDVYHLVEYSEVEPMGVTIEQMTKKPNSNPNNNAA